MMTIISHIATVDVGGVGVSVDVNFAIGLAVMLTIISELLLNE